MQTYGADSLREWVGLLETRLSELNAKVRPQLAEIEKIKQQLELVQRLLKLETDGGTIPESALNSSKAGGGAAGLSSGASTGDVLAEILRASERPLHISEIRDRFLASGRAIPGRGTETNLISYMVRDGRFARVAKGTYQLASPVEIGSAPTRRRRRKRSRRPRQGIRKALHRGAIS